MEYLSHVVVNAGDLDFGSDEEFGESVSAYTIEAGRTGSLYYYAKGNHFSALQKNVIANDEAIVLFSNSRNVMISLLKKWAEKSGEKTHIASKRQLGIVCGMHDKGTHSGLGTFIGGQGATLVSNTKTLASKFKRWRSGNQVMHSPQVHGYSMQDAKRDASTHNIQNKFYYCYVGMPKIGMDNVGMTVLVNHAINALILSSWLKDGNKTTSM